jgi:hypothetical protein
MPNKVLQQAAEHDSFLELERKTPAEGPGEVVQSSGSRRGRLGRPRGLFRLVNFKPGDHHVPRGGEAEPDFAPIHIDDGHQDPPVDHDGFVFLPR